MESRFTTPILFIIFNRPDTTQLVFNEIKKIKPTKLFVVADGPRSHKEGEKDRCDQAKNIIDQVDWDCEVVKNFSDTNLGCGKRVSSGITWFFENVESGIILEDDCVPDQSFFPFCQDLLEKYKYDERIMMISGNNFQFGKKRGGGSYYFSKYNHIWGWASWRRAWEYYDYDIKTFPSFLENKEIENIWPSSKNMQAYWVRNFKKVFFHTLDTWDYQWTYVMWKEGGLCILPNVNLVKNIGFDDRSTHTKIRVLQPEVKAMLSLVHPTFIIQSFSADYYTYKRTRSFFSRIINYILL